MMLPSSLPLVRLFAAASAGQPRPGAAMAGFLGGYALVWSVFGALAFLFDVGVHAAVDSSPWLGDHDWLLGGSVLALAGAFQFTKLKDACLDKCRHPGHFLIRFYERGTAGGFRLGARHGVFCLGCCWALMLVMFSVGVASLGWMAVLTALMVYEKTQPSGARSVPVTGCLAAGGRARSCCSSPPMPPEPAPTCPASSRPSRSLPPSCGSPPATTGCRSRRSPTTSRPAGLHYLLIHYDIPVVDPAALAAERCRVRGARAVAVARRAALPARGHARGDAWSAPGTAARGSRRGR